MSKKEEMALVHEHWEACKELLDEMQTVLGGDCWEAALLNAYRLKARVANLQGENEDE